MTEADIQVTMRRLEAELRAALSNPRALPPDAAAALDAIEREAPEYASLWGQFLFEQLLGIEWTHAQPEFTVIDGLYRPIGPDGRSV